MVGVTGFEPALSSPQTRSETITGYTPRKISQIKYLDALFLSPHNVEIKVCCKHLSSRLVLFLSFQLTHLCEVRHKERDRYHAVVVSTFIIWSFQLTHLAEVRHKYDLSSLFFNHIVEKFFNCKRTKAVAINENQLVFPGGIEPLGSFQLIYAVSLEG